jgi:hypothetical protein
MGRRFTIAQLLAVIAVSGIAFAALRSPSYLWANTLYTTAFIALVIAGINVVYSHGRSRAYWVGFLIGGGVYFIVYSVPALREPVCPRLLTEPILDLIYPYVSPKPPVATTILDWNGVGTVTGTVIRTAPTLLPVRSGWAAWTEPDRGTGVGYTIGTVSLVTPETFRQVGHSLLILICAIGGGIYARRRFEHRSGETR